MLNGASDKRSGAWLVGLVLALAVAVQILGTYTSQHPSWFPVTVPHSAIWIPATALPYLIGLACLARFPMRPRRMVTVVLGVTAVLQALALSRLPRTSNDVLRYILDGKVQLAGIDPYRYAPSAPQLLRLHEPLLYTNLGCAAPIGCPLLNRPDAHTIYPPVAQAFFDLVRLATFGGHGGERGFQVAAALGVLVITGLLLRRSWRLGRPLWPAAAWGWCPIVVSEFGNNAHVDWLAILLSLLGIGAYTAARPRLAGALVGAAIATKLYPLLLLPSLLRRNPVKVLGAAVLVTGLGYLPHVLAVGGRVVGYLPGYLNEEGYSDGSRLVLLGRVLPHPFDNVVGFLVLAAAAVWCYLRADPTCPEASAVTLCGVTFLVLTPDYGWYGAILVALIASTSRWQWLPVAFAPSATYLYGPLFRDRYVSDTITWIIAAALALGIWFVGNRSSRPAGPVAEQQVSTPVPVR